MLLQLFTTLAAAQAGSAAPAAAPQTPSAVAACASAEYHQFDFWAGHWDVYNKAGKLVAHSLIEPVYGCGIRENWMPLNNQPGGPLSIYVPEEKGWGQCARDSSRPRAVFSGVWT